MCSRLDLLYGLKTWKKAREASTYYDLSPGHSDDLTRTVDIFKMIWNNVEGKDSNKVSKGGTIMAQFISLFFIPFYRFWENCNIDPSFMIEYVIWSAFFLTQKSSLQYFASHSRGSGDIWAWKVTWNFHRFQWEMQCLVLFGWDAPSRSLSRRDAAALKNRFINKESFLWVDEGLDESVKSSLNLKNLVHKCSTPLSTFFFEIWAEVASTAALDQASPGSSFNFACAWPQSMAATAYTARIARGECWKCWRNWAKISGTETWTFCINFFHCCHTSQSELGGRDLEFGDHESFPKCGAIWRPWLKSSCLCSLASVWVNSLSKGKGPTLTGTLHCILWKERI